MASNTLIMSYVLRKNNNDKSLSYGHYYAYVNSPGTLTTRGLAEHMIEHGLVADRSEVESMLIKLSKCIPELVAQGYGVKLDGLGIFKATIANKTGGVQKVEDFNVAEHIDGVRFNFVPDSTNLDDMTRKAFKKKVTFGNGFVQEGAGRKKVLKPLNYDGSDEGGDDNGNG